MKMPLDYESPGQQESPMIRRHFNYLICAAVIALVHIFGTTLIVAYAMSNFDNLGDHFQTFARVYEFPMNIDAITSFFVLPKMGSSYGVDFFYITVDAIIWGFILAGIVAMVVKYKTKRLLEV